MIVDRHALGFVSRLANIVLLVMALFVLVESIDEGRNDFKQVESRFFSEKKSHFRMQTQIHAEIIQHHRRRLVAIVG
jgi:hypothetical protein